MTAHGAAAIDPTPRRNWLDPAWQDEVRVWATDRLAGSGRTLTGALDPVRVRPWSAVFRATTTTDRVWFKANSAGSGYEAALVEALAGWTPDAVLTPLAVDTARGWLLTADAGPTMREALAERPDPHRWEPMLTAYAGLQRALVPHVDELVALGVPDLRPARLPTLLAGLLDDPQVAAGLGGDRLAALRGLQPAYADWCAELAGDGLPATLQHDDLTDGNVFAIGAGYRFFDWGDASVGHPFGTLLVALSSASYQFKLPPAGPAAHRLRDAFLQPWAPGYDRARLERSCLLATRVARVGRALAWQRVLRGPGVEPDGEHRAAVWEWLGELLGPDLF